VNDVLLAVVTSAGDVVLFHCLHSAHETNICLLHSYTYLYMSVTCRGAESKRKHKV